MSFWDQFSNLARRLLGTEGARPVNLAEVTAHLAPQPATHRRVTIPVAPVKPPKLETAADEDTIEELPEYRFILESIKANVPALFVTGRAGTGKSTLIRFLARRIKDAVVVAPTALAASNVQGTTIHSFFGFPPRFFNADDLPGTHPQQLPVFKNLSLLIIDEVSMVTPNLVDAISNRLIAARDDPRPFGGVTVIFLGDLLQLPPVVDKEAAAQFFTHSYPTPYFFSAHIFRNLELGMVELTRVFRQTDQAFINLLDRIRLNQTPHDDVARLNRECYRDRRFSQQPTLTLVPKNDAAAAINHRKLAAMPGRQHQFRAITTGTIKQEEDRFQAPWLLRLKVNARVLFVKNNRPHWLNGTLGKVTHIAEDHLRVQIDGAGNIVTVERSEWESVSYRYDSVEKRIHSTVTGTFRQFPLTLGWAVTIHKSQGMSLNRVCIDLGPGGAFCPGQTYVALSRCRSMEGITLKTPLRIGDIRTARQIVEFYQTASFLRFQQQEAGIDKENRAPQAQSAFSAPPQQDIAYQAAHLLREGLYSYRIGPNTYGPADKAHLIRMIEEGNLLPKHFISSYDSNEWMTLGRILRQAQDDEPLI